jgi:LPPG:FO 2-phospho-L-lactate transferase
MSVVTLAGGVGGAKLVDGLAHCLPAEDLCVIVNIGDDFEHLGLKICPDLDTVCYTLAGLANPETGWGREGETWRCLENLERLGGSTWFRLGDSDLATHLERTRLLKEGASLSQVTERFCKMLAVGVKVLPASNNLTPTWVQTDIGLLPFQEYFVQRQCQPAVRGFHFENVENAIPAPGVVDAIREARLVLIAPSNPWVSIDPILSIAGIKDAIRGKVTIAVSPIISGQAVRGPAAKMYTEMGIQPSALAVAQHYAGLLSGLVIDRVDEALKIDIYQLGIKVLVTDTWMRSVNERKELAKKVLEFGKSLLIEVEDGK